MHGADDEDLSAQPEYTPEHAPGYTIAGPAITLVVRAWLEPVAGAPPVLRGTVAQLGGAMLGAFNSIEALAALVDRHLARTPKGQSHNAPH